MSAAEMAVEESGNEGAPLEGSAGEVGSVSSPSQDTTPDSGAPSRPEWLLEGYSSAEEQAQALHKHHQQYGGNHDFYAQQGAYISDRYHSDPAFREWFDNYRQGKQAQAEPKKQEPPPYDKSNPDTLEKFWNEAIADPDRLFQLAEERAFARIQKELGPQLAQLKQAQNAERAQRLFSTHKATLQEMQGNPYGQRLLALTNRGMDPEEAIATYQAAKQQFAAQQAAAAQTPAKTQEPVRDPQGRFQRTAGNGRRAGVVQSGKALTPDEIIAEAKAGRLR